MASSGCDKPFFRDAFLVSVAGFVLAWQAYGWITPEALITLTVEGKTCQIDLTADLSEDLAKYGDAAKEKNQRELEVVQRQLADRFPSRSDGFSTMVRWQQEVAELYAADNLKRAERLAASAARADESIRLASTGSRPVQGAATDPSVDQALRWQAYWTRTSERAGEWLGQQTDRRQTALRDVAWRLLAERDARRVATLPAGGMIGAALIGLAIFILAWAWQWAQPRRELVQPPCEIDAPSQRDAVNVTAAGTPAGRSSDAVPTATLTFRRHWIAVRQPWGVWLRGAAGFGVVLAAFVSICLGQLSG